MSHHPTSREERTAGPVAIIGMGCLFPKARDLKEYWRSIRLGTDGITEVPPTHWTASDYLDPDPRSPDRTYCARGGFLSPVRFDPIEFGIPPTALEATDTAQLLGLVVAKQAMDDAGYGDGREFNRERTSVILGVTGTLELALPLAARLGHPIWRKALREAGVASDVAEEVVERIAEGYVPWQENSFPGLLGNVVAGRIANRLNLRGTNCVVDAACASSLSAIHLAMLELSNRRSDMVLTGGVDTLNDIFMYMCFSKTPALSPTGDARPFSDDADGTVLGEGLGMVVLKRLEDAQRDGDRIYAVIRGVGTSSDGRSQSIYAPHSAGQARCLRNAYQTTGIHPTSVELIEAHGTGTKVGDAVEFEALKTVFREARATGAWCGVGSVKSQIGHTKAAAGAAGLIKAALALHYRVLPPTIKVTRPNAKAGITDSPFYLNTEARPWSSGGEHPRRAGVSSFGFGGSNFHVVLEESPTARPEPAWDGSVEIIALSASSPGELADRLRVWEAMDEGDLESLPFRAAEARGTFRRSDGHRLVIVLEHGADVTAIARQARARLEQAPPEGRAVDRAWSLPNISYGCGEPEGRVAILFPGQGSQYCNMGRDLACIFPEVLASFVEAESVQGEPRRLADAVFPRPALNAEERSAQEAALTRTDFAQPAIGALCAGLALVLERFGVSADFAAGHSFGELVALWYADRIDAPALHRLARLRGRLMADDGGDRGTMLAVQAPLAQIDALIESERLAVVLANRNSPNQGVLSGAHDAIARADDACRQRGWRTRKLPVSGAFHSELMHAAHGPFRNALEAVQIESGRISVFANATGKPYPGDAGAARDLLAAQIIRPVCFVEQIENLYDAGARVFVEVGPKAILSSLVQATLGDRPFSEFALDASSGRRSGLADLARALAQLAADGRPVELARWERPARELRKPKMVVPLVGANYRAPRLERPVNANCAPALCTNEAGRETPQRATLAAEDMDVPFNEDVNRPRETPIAQTRSLSESSMSNPHRSEMESFPQPTHPPIAAESAVPRTIAATPDMIAPTLSNASAVSDALRIVQEGLRAMQALQQQTAAAHERFLQGQEAAQQTFARLMDAQRLMFQQVAAGTQPSPSAPTQRLSSPSPAAVGQPSVRAESRSEELRAPEGRQPVAGVSPRIGPLQNVSPGGAAETPPARPVTIAPSVEQAAPPAAPTPVAESTPQSKALSSLEPIVLAIVSEKTGYPIEMLDPDMDIEADLGIDSIKRVEIIAGIEERAPHATSIQPENMGSLRTLRQIMTFMGASSTSAPTATETVTSGATSPTTPATTIGISITDAADELLSVVAQLTGYPREMLELDMDLEADLGIDSIKRVEILASLEARAPHFKSVNPEYMGSLRTLRQIVEYSAGVTTSLAAVPSGEPPRPESAQIVQPGPEVSPPTPVAATPTTQSVPLSRRVLQTVDLPPVSDGPIPIAAERDVWIFDDGTRLTPMLAALLESRGIGVRVVEPASAGAPIERPVGGLIVLAAKSESSDGIGETGSDEFLKSAFAVVQRVSKDLQAAAAAGGAFLITVSRMDGAFGLRGGDFDPVPGGLAGLAKTAACEWPGVRCRSLDVSPAWSEDSSIAEAILREISAAGPIEVGLDAARRRSLEMAASAIDARSQPIVSTGDVWVITGGGRGVTAEAALALARHHQMTLVLLGRTAAPADEPVWASGITDEGALKQAILTHAFADRRPSPAELQSAYRRLLADRELRTNFARLAETEARFEYRAVDVRDAAAVAETLADVRRSIGPIRGLVHASGVIEDRRIEDKTPAQFAAVLDTKVAGLRNLLRAMREDDLSHIVLFSSVSARVGNVGQVDYAMANEVLNKAAHRLAALRPNCRVVSINWGPWDGGMVGPELRREFERRGVGLIPLAAGAEAMAQEVACDDPAAVEVVIGSMFHGSQEEPTSSVDHHSSAAPVPVSRPSMGLAFERVLDIERHPILASHMLAGRAVLPVAIILEWLGHAALHGNPGMQWHGLDELRVLKGVVLDNSPRTLRAYAAKARRNGTGYEVEVELRGGSAADREIVHARATVALGGQLPDAEPYAAPADWQLRPYERGVRGAYDDVLFHGAQFHAIERIDGSSSRGLAAVLRAAPAPAEWMTDPLRSAWLADPLVLDGAFQAAILWCYEELGAVCLPHRIGRYRQYARVFPSAGVSAFLSVRESSRHCVRGDVDFVDGGRRVARIEGLECTVDASLHAAFRSSRRSGTEATGGVR